MLKLYISVVLIYLFILLNTALGLTFDVNVNTGTPVRSVPDQFLSVSFDTSNARSFTTEWNGLNFSFIEPLASALKPVYFRFGGSASDLVTFQANSTKASSSKSRKDSPYEFILTGTQLDQLYTFSKNVGWRLIYDFNELFHRNTSDSRWDSSNAKELLDYASTHGYDFDFELGNEQDIVSPYLSGATVAQDYQDLRNLLNSYDLYKNSIIIGPSTANAYLGDMLGDFIKNGGGNYINALSFHQYYFGGAGSKLEDYMNTTIMDMLKVKISYVVSLGFSSNWLGETSSAFNGGGVNFSDTFVAGYLWLDKLGLSALHGLDVVVRQELYGSFQIGAISSYCLLNMMMVPAPDYWLSFLYKKIVGQQVLNVTFTPSNTNLRIYAASSAKGNGFVVYGFNLLNDSITLDFPQIATKQVTAYVVTENEPGNLQSFFSKLNDETLVWTSHQPITNIKGKITTLPLELPGYSQFFIVLGQTTNQQCPDGWIKETSTASKCIKFVNQTQTQPWFAANFDCSVYGNNASLLSIANSFENAEIYKSSQAYSSTCKQFYIGLYRNGNNFAWSDNNPSTYKNWKSGYPTNDATHNCVTFDITSGLWYNSDCDASQCYICEQYV